ncbi:mucin-5AC-like [Dermacentor silvarum]|uniref:mucin-5AC-like n=1 Tax=Dermacentor silvarum TaxID=543639 RepID=UPI0021016FB5|nr:mucin-5AC-like [Dermacentor silvarum]
MKGKPTPQASNKRKRTTTSTTSVPTTTTTTATTNTPATAVTKTTETKCESTATPSEEEMPSAVTRSIRTTTATAWVRRVVPQNDGDEGTVIMNSSTSVATKGTLRPRSSTHEQSTPSLASAVSSMRTLKTQASSVTPKAFNETTEHNTTPWTTSPVTSLTPLPSPSPTQTSAPPPTASPASMSTKSPEPVPKSSLKLSLTSLPPTSETPLLPQNRVTYSTTNSEDSLTINDFRD